MKAHPTMSQTPQSWGSHSLILANGSLPPVGFAQRVAAAAGAGFDAIGLSLREYRRLVAVGHTSREMRTVLDDHGLRLTELEILRGFSQRDGGTSPAHRSAAGPADDLATVWEMAEAFDARHVQVVGTPGADVLEEHAVASFGALCDAAAERGLLVALEFVPAMTNIPDIATASHVVSSANRPNGGLCVDSWHHFRGAQDWDMLAQVPAQQVLVVQIDDGPRTPVEEDFLQDTVRHRRPPGEGQFDLTRFLRTLWAAGVRAPLSVEVLSDDLRRDPVDKTARTLADSTRAVLAAAREPQS